MNNQKLKDLAPAVLRWGLAIVLFWFAYNQLSNASQWARMIPEWTSIISSNTETIVYINAIVEILLGILLLVGIWTRVVAIIVMLHLAQITFTVVGGFSSPNGIRDFGLTIAALSIALHGKDNYCLDSKLSK